jgi:hypothetical protein
MKIANQLSIAWIQKEGRSRDELVVVHSRPMTPSDAEEAWQKLLGNRWIAPRFHLTSDQKVGGFESLQARHVRGSVVVVRLAVTIARFCGNVFAVFVTTAIGGHWRLFCLLPMIAFTTAS